MKKIKKMKKMKEMKTMDKVNAEIEKVVARVKSAQETLQGMLKNQAWVDDAKKYAERQGKEVKKLLKTDLFKVKAFLERERKDLEHFQKQIPAEVKKISSFVKTQKKEFEKLLDGVKKAGVKVSVQKKGKTKKTGAASASKKKKASSKQATSESSSTGNS